MAQDQNLCALACKHIRSMDGPSGVSNGGSRIYLPTRESSQAAWEHTPAGYGQ